MTFEGREAGLYTLLAEVAAATPLDPRPGRTTARRPRSPSARRARRRRAASSPSSPAALIDTRNAPNGTWAGPALAAQAERVFPIVGQCGVPPTAKAVAVNVTVTGSTGGGFLRAYAAFPASVPTTSVLNFNAGATRANNAIVALSPDGQITVFNGMASGTRTSCWTWSVTSSSPQRGRRGRRRPRGPAAASAASRTRCRVGSRRMIRAAGTSSAVRAAEGRDAAAVARAGRVAARPS